MHAIMGVGTELRCRIFWLWVTVKNAQEAFLAPSPPRL